MGKVLISDKMSPRAEQVFKERGVPVDYKPGLSPEELKEIIGNYSALAIRSATKVTPEILEAAPKLKVIARAGIGVDNVDIPTATKFGVIVMNTPFGNAITTAEHAIAMMMAVARHIPQANASTHEGKWEKSKFMGTELYGKILGVIGCGNIGSIVADRAVGLKMRVLASDPFLSDERAVELGVEKVELDDLYRQADFITLHTPLTDGTRGMINRETFARMKDGVYIINCARGGLVVEEDLKEALDSGKVAGAAIDVYSVEPAKENILFGHEKVVCTPHLGASTEEAQVNVAVQVAEQISDYLLTGAVTNALNMPSISAQDAPKLKPYMELAEQLGSFLGQICDSTIREIEIDYAGAVAGLNTKPLTAMIVAALLRPVLDSVNMVSARTLAEERGIAVTTSKRETCRNFATCLTINVKTSQRDYSIGGTLYEGKHARIVNVDSVPMEATLSEHMLYVRNQDKPGMIGGLGTLLGDAGVNIADFKLGRIEGADKAVALVSVDDVIPDDVVKAVEALPQVTFVKALRF